MYRRSSQLISRGVLRGSSKPLVAGGSMPKISSTKLRYSRSSNLFATFRTASWGRPKQTLAGRSAEDEPTVDEVRTIETKIQGYYDDSSSANFHNQVWGDTIHIGRYDLLVGEDAKLEGKERMKRASELATELLLAKAFSQSAPPPSESIVMDMGSSKGDLARRAARMYGCTVMCIDLSVRFNTVNAERSAAAGLSDKVVIPGERSYFDTGMEASSMDIVVSQEAFLHASTAHHRAVKEAARVLKPGGIFAFTDLIRSESADEVKLAELYKQMKVDRLASLESYKIWAHDYGLDFVEHYDSTSNSTTHFSNLLDMAKSLRGSIDGVDEEFLAWMRKRYGAWLDASNSGLVTTGGFVFKKME